MISGLLKLWMSSKAPPMDMDPPPPCPMIPTLIYLSMPVLGMTKLKWKLSSRHPPSPRPGQPSRPSFRPQSQHSGPTKPIRRYDGPMFLPPQIYKLLSQDAMKALKATTLRPSLDSIRGRSAILKLWKPPRMNLLGPQYLKMTSLSFLKVTSTSLMIPFSTL